MSDKNAQNPTRRAEPWHAAWRGTLRSEPTAVKAFCPFCILTTVRAPASFVFLVLGLASTASTMAQPQAGPPPTYGRDVAPLLSRHCIECHSAGGTAPFPLTTYNEVRRHATQLAAVTKSGFMPPWKPVEGGPFEGERRLSAEERDVLQRWASSGALPGTPDATAIDVAQSKATSAGWLHGEPDLVLQLAPYTLRADGPDVFRNFAVTVPGDRVRYVRGLQLIPGSAAIHHANIRVDATDTSRRLDAADPDGGYEGFVPRSADYPTGHFLGWTPGQAPPPASSEFAWVLRPGSDLAVQLHLYPTGKAEIIAPRIGLYLTDTAPARVPSIVRLGRQTFRMPAGDERFAVEDTFELPVDAQMLAIQPHAHYRARDVRVSATLPDGTQRTLLTIADWDFAWQDQYRYASPFWLPAGTRIAMSYRFDNSNRNPRNPDHPPRAVEWGWRSADEMADVWIQAQTRSDDDRARFSRAARRKMAEEDALGSEVLIRRQPDYAELRNDAALIDMELGRYEDARRHFSAVTRLEPGSAAAWFNEGTALERLGRSKDAADRYRRAIALAPTHSAAHNNLGSLLLADGRTDEALAEYRRAVDADARNIDAQNNLGALLIMSDLSDAETHLNAALSLDPVHAGAHFNLARALTIRGRATEAVRHYRIALAERPEWPPALINLAWLLAAHTDAAVRSPSDAVVIASRAVSATKRQDAVALDALACAQAAAGRFDEAAQTAQNAADLATQSGRAELAAAIKERAALYRAKKPFLLD